MTYAPKSDALIELVKKHFPNAEVIDIKLDPSVDLSGLPGLTEEEKAFIVEHERLHAELAKKYKTTL